MDQYNTDKQNWRKTGDVEQKIPDALGLVTTTVLKQNTRYLWFNDIYCIEKYRTIYLTLVV